jgi:hypothetical protein
MAKGQHLSAHQQKIVRRYYDNADTITMTKLQELVTEIYLAEGAKAAALWKRAAEHLRKTTVPPDVAERLVAARDVKRLAEVITTARAR